MALVTGPSNADGCDLYRTDSTGTKGGGEAGQPKAFTTPRRQEVTMPKGMMDGVGRGCAKKQTERERGKHFVADHQNKQHPTQKDKLQESKPQAGTNEGLQFPACLRPECYAHSM